MALYMTLAALSFSLTWITLSAWDWAWEKYKNKKYIRERQEKLAKAHEERVEMEDLEQPETIDAK